MAITTANQLDYTKLCFNSLSNHKPAYIDLIVIDDASVDGTQSYCEQSGIKIISKSRAEGLTHSWNLAYEYFKRNNYDSLIIANNDILIPPHSLNHLIDGLGEYTIIGPMSTLKGVHHQPLQAVTEYYDQLSVDPNSPDNYLIVQQEIESTTKVGNFKELSFLNGFFFAFNRNVIKYEYSDSQLFDPNNINIANEDELCSKVIEPKAVSTKSFIFHYKGISFDDYEHHDGYLMDRNLTWEKAKNMKTKGWKFQLYRLKRKLGIK